MPPTTGNTGDKEGYTDVVSYVGDTKNGMRHGHGTVRFLNGDHYTGKFAEDVFCGKGVYTFGSGDRYDGYFWKNRYHGTGTLTRASGFEYSCESWQAGVMTGYGTCSRNGTAVYKGHWRNYKYHGKGVLVQGGATYEGEFRDGLYHGIGTLTMADGDEYSCDSWRRGFMNGHGTYRCNGTTVYKGYWKNSKYHGEGELQLVQRGETYEGKFRDGVFRHGKVTKPRLVYVGMVDDKLRPDGKGVMYYDKQTATVEQRGRWVGGKREGVMRSVLNNGQKCSAVYQDDKVVRGVVAFRNKTRPNIYVMYKCGGKGIPLTLKTAVRASVVIQRALRDRKQRMADAENAAAVTIQGYARTWLRIHRMRRKTGGTRKARKPKRKPTNKAPKGPPTELMGWCHTIKADHNLSTQMHRERQRRAAAKQATAPVKPAEVAVYALEVDLHGETVRGAIERLRAAVMSQRLAKVPEKNRGYFWGYIRVITGKGNHGDYPVLRKEIRKTLIAWGASYSATDARDGNGTDGYSVKVTDKLRDHVQESLLAQTHPVRPGVRVM